MSTLAEFDAALRAALAEVDRLRVEVAEWKQAAETEASLRRRVLDTQGERERAVWMPGGAFCDCGRVEFVVPGPACVRVEERGTEPTQHTPNECRTATFEERANLDPPPAALAAESRPEGEREAMRQEVIDALAAEFEALGPDPLALLAAKTVRSMAAATAEARASVALDRDQTHYVGDDCPGGHRDQTQETCGACGHTEGVHWRNDEERAAGCNAIRPGWACTCEGWRVPGRAGREP